MSDPRSPESERAPIAYTPARAPVLTNVMAAKISSSHWHSDGTGGCIQLKPSLALRVKLPGRCQRTRTLTQQLAPGAISVKSRT